MSYMLINYNEMDENADSVRREVPGEVAAPGKRLVALGTRKRFLSRVNTEVVLQPVLVRKGLVALGTSKRLLSRVNTEVVLEVGALRKRLGAGGALKALGVPSDVRGPVKFVR
jgi:hypothetical protein